MGLANAVVEDLTFLPRLVPFSLGSPFAKVACGPNFVLALTKVGVK